MSENSGKQKGPNIVLGGGSPKAIGPAPSVVLPPTIPVAPATAPVVAPVPAAPFVIPVTVPPLDKGKGPELFYDSEDEAPESSSARRRPQVKLPPPATQPRPVNIHGTQPATQAAPARAPQAAATPGSTRLRNPTSANTVRVNVDDEDSDYVVLTRDRTEDTGGWNFTDDCAVELTANYTVNQMLLDINGSTGYSEDKAALATIPNALYLQVTEGLELSRGYEIGRDPFCADGTIKGSLEYQRRIVLFLWANTRALLDAGLNLSNAHALFLAYLRLQVVLAGGTASNLEERAVYVDEYTENDADINDVDYDILPVTPILTGFLNDHWLQYVALLRHLFVTRGHHYKNEYRDMITKTWAATTIGTPEGLAIPEWRHILRSALHCFGIRILNLLTIEGFHMGTLAKAFETRIDAAPAGAAYVRTAWAVVESMKQAQWFPSFYAAYTTQIDSLEEDAAYGHRVGLRAHINAKLFNWRWSRIIISDASVRALAPLLLGFLDTLERGESLRGQKTLNKRGDGGSALRAQFSGVLVNEQRNARYMETAHAFFSGFVATRAG